MESFYEMCGEIGKSPYAPRIAFVLIFVLVILFIITGRLKIQKKSPFLKIKWD